MKITLFLDLNYFFLFLEGLRWKRLRLLVFIPFFIMNAQHFCCWWIYCLFVYVLFWGRKKSRFIFIRSCCSTTKLFLENKRKLILCINRFLELLFIVLCRWNWKNWLCFILLNTFLFSLFLFFFVITICPRIELYRLRWKSEIHFFYHRQKHISSHHYILQQYILFFLSTTKN